jgi:hypothetical protein
MDFDYAVNYWRKVFVESSEGQFTNRDFDKWFRSGISPRDIPTQFFGIVDAPGSREHFDLAMRTALVAMLEACVAGRFGEG